MFYQYTNLSFQKLNHNLKMVYRRTGLLLTCCVAIISKIIITSTNDSDDTATGAALARYAIASRRRLATQGFGALLKGPDWAEIAG